MKKTYFFLFILFIINIYYVKGQDVHFSQFYNTPTFYNPANSGVFDGDLRMGMYYKNQWGSMPKGYNTYAFAIDGAFMVRNEISYKKNYIGYSAYVLNDQAGDLNLSNLETMFAVSYNLEIAGNEISNHNLAMGINLGFNMRTFSPLNGEWGSQWNEIYQIYESSVDPNEYIFTERKYNLDVGFGFTYIYNKDKFRPYDKLHIEIGLACTHLNVPKFSFFSPNDTIQNRIQPRVTAHTLVSFPVLKQELFIQPVFIFSVQQKYYDVSLGANIRYLFKSMGFDNRNKAQYDLGCNLGLHYRFLNSVVFLAGLEYCNSIIGNFGLNCSYDLTTSKLSNKNKFNGGPEIALTYSVAIPSLHKFKHKKRDGNINPKRVKSTPEL